MAGDLVEMALGVFGQPFAQAAGALSALYAFLMLLDAIRRVFRYRED